MWVYYIFEFLGNTDLVSTVLGSYTQFYILRQVYLWEVVCSVGASLDSQFTLIHPILNIIFFRLHPDIEVDHFASHDDLFIPAGIFDHESEAQKATFLRAVEAVNDDRTILTKSLVMTDINDYPHDDSFKASKKLCEMVQSSVAGIFGPTK